MDMIAKGKGVRSGIIGKIKLGSFGPGLSLSAASIAENSAPGTTIGVAVPVNASNPGAVSIVSQTLANAIVMTGDGITFAVGSAGGPTGTINYEAVQSFSVTFTFTDDNGTYEFTRAFQITNVADGPTTAGATTNLEAMIGAAQATVQVSGDLRTLFVSPTSQALSFAVSHGSVSGGFNWTWTPASAGAVTVTITATDADGQALPISLALTVVAAPVTNTAPVAGNLTAEFLVPPPPASVAPSNTVAPAITGTVKVGQTLTASSGTWAGDAPITFTYQWQDSANGTSGWSNLSGETASTYTIAAGEDGKYLRCNVTGTNGTGNATAATAATAQVTYNAPTNSVVPAVTGTTAVGQTLTTDNGTWANSPSFARKWQVSNDGSTGWSDISGATSSTFVLTSSELGKYLRSVVTGTNSGGSASANSTATTVISAALSAPTYFGRTSPTPSFSTLNCAWPASHAVDDVAVLFISSRGDQASSQDLTSLGWASLGLTTESGAGTSAYRQRRAWWKRATSTAEPDVAISDTGDINGPTMFVIRGCRTSGAPVAVLDEAFGTSASLQVVIPGASTSGDQRFILGYFTLAFDSTTQQMGGGYSNSNLTSLTNRLSNQTSANIGMGQYSFDGVLATQGAVGNTTGTIATDGLNWVSALLEFIP